ncbi:MAG: AmmeMemoRadiSam system protein A [Nanoarchaeota archaeon]|nr:AmmeMemoRadiSam system protein A [DPANN group archaeon]MBL7117084.1 AmmeMemoRadiSam system protein A [Nanoarchaeota archaeon]
MNEEDKKLLLKLAREAIVTHFKRQEPNINDVMHLNEEQGVFVTLHKNKQLRGCIGFPEPIMSLYKAVIEAAREAAFGDPRFPLLTKDELRDVEIEISVITVPELIKVNDSTEYTKNISIGRNGLIIRSVHGSGLLLPQVAIEHNFTVGQFLNCLCQKAGLPFSAWEDLNNQIYKFQAEVFSE